MTVITLLTQMDALELIAEAFNEPAEELVLTATRDDLEGWDSMGGLLLIAELDERFDVLMTEDDFAQINNIGDILIFFSEKGLIA